MFAAIGAARQGARVILLEKGDRLGKKLLISGGGRCNVTSAWEIDELIKNTPGNGRFLYSAYAKWSNRDIIDFFEEHGVKLKEEDHGRLFPVSDRAETILSAIVAELERLGVEMILRQPVRELIICDNRVVGVKTDQKNWIADAAVVATGGITAAATGSTGDGYRFAEAAGHALISPYPTSVPLVSANLLIQERLLQGIAVTNVKVKLIDDRKKVHAVEEGDLLFTHFGVSGPVALRVSQFFVKVKHKNPAATLEFEIDFVPEQSAIEIKHTLQSLAEENPRKNVKSLVKMFVPERLAEALLLETSLVDKQSGECGKDDWEQVMTRLKKWRLGITGTLGLERAFVTGGGVSLSGVDPKSMASKTVDGLYFAGEVLDIHAHTGGYNLTAAFSTGYVAGASATIYAGDQMK